MTVAQVVRTGVWLEKRGRVWLVVYRGETVGFGTTPSEAIAALMLAILSIKLFAAVR